VIANALLPWALTWSEVDPARHGFDASEAYPIALRLIPQTKPSDHAWMQAITEAFVAQYGKWACGMELFVEGWTELLMVLPKPLIFHA
jgi:hypothetical protein